MGRFFALIFAIAAGVGGSQVPGFTLQYMQNLTGRVDVLEPIVKKFDEDVAKYGYTRSRALSECNGSDGLLQALCSSSASTIEQFTQLSKHLAELRAAKPLMKPIALARSFRREIVESAKKEFKPVVPTTLDGAVYGGGAFAFIWLVCTLLFGLLGKLTGRRNRNDGYAY